MKEGTQMPYDIKDSGSRQSFTGGAVRDTEEGKLDYSNLFVWFEPMGTRYVAHMTKGRTKYPDPEPGTPNWSLFEATPETLARTERSLDRHYKAYRMGQTDEDHAAAILFNLNLAEKIRAALDGNYNIYVKSAALHHIQQEGKFRQSEPIEDLCECSQGGECRGPSPVQASFEPSIGNVAFGDGDIEGAPV